jgi:hypothetical protein
MAIVGALRFRLGRWLRRRFGSALVLTLVVAAAGVAVLAMAAGARRTSTAPDRYTRAHDTGIDVSGQQDSGRPRTAELAALPGVRRARSMSYLFGGIKLDGSADTFDSLVFAGSYEVIGARLVAGRAPDARRAGEFVVTRTFAETNGLQVDDEMTLRTATQEDADIYGYDPAHVNGPQIDAVLVGILEKPALLDDSSGIAVFSPALLDDGRIGVGGTVIGLELEDGMSLDDLRAQVGTLPRPEEFTFKEMALVSADTRTAVRGQSLGLWLLAGIAAAVTIAAMGQLVARSVRHGVDEASSLSALGYDRKQMVTESALRATLVVVAALVLAVAGAIAVSGVFPFGFARPLEPHRGVRVEAVPLLAGALILVVGLLGWVALFTRPQRDRGRGGQSTVDVLAGRCPTPSMATGVRFAFTAGTHPTTTVASVVGTTAFVAALVGTLTFAVSVRRLVDEPARYGSNFDSLVDSGASELPPGVTEFLRSSPEVTAFTLYAASQARVGDSTIAVVAMDPVRGDLSPPVLSGRLPRGSDEVALGRRSARELGASIGGEIELTTDTGTAAYQVTGLVIPPGLRGNDTVGNGAVITREGLARLKPDVTFSAAAVEVDGTLTPDRMARLASEAGIYYDGSTPTRPPAILNLARITFVPFVLAALLAALVGLLVVNFVYSGVRRGDVPVAVLRALGADRPWILRATLWQAVASTIVPVAIGAPLGFVAGRHAFRVLAEHVGTVTDPATPLVLTTCGIAALLAAAMIAATTAGRPARRTRPAPLLRAG